MKGDFSGDACPLWTGEEGSSGVSGLGGVKQDEI